MRDIFLYAEKCKKELDRLKIRYAQNIVFAVNTRAKTRLGVCKKSGDKYKIEIAYALLDEKTDEQLLYDTLFHEVLHTCRGCMKHTGRWKELAEKVNAACGCNITRTTEGDILPDSLVQKPKYRVVCPTCGEVFERYKRSPLIADPGRYRCGKCKGSLKNARIFKAV